MNEQPSNILIRIPDDEVGFSVVASERPMLQGLPLPPEDYKWLISTTDSTATKVNIPDEPEEMKRADVAHVFALFFVVTLCILFGLGVIIGKVLL